LLKITAAEHIWAIVEGERVIAAAAILRSWERPSNLMR